MILIAKKGLILLEDLKSSFRYPPLLTAIILILFIGQWSTLYLEVAIDVDMGWLLQCLDRFLSGGTYKTDFYETNPPLSFIIYLPAYPLYTFLGIDAKLSVFVIFMGYILLSNYVLYRLLQSGGYKAHEIAVIISAVIMSETWGSALAYGSKDHLILIFMIPLSLYQYLNTMQKQIPTMITASSIIMGAIAICLKPHYGIITALLFAHRLYVRKSITPIFKSTDFLGLLAGGISYFIFIIIFTPEYFDLLPEIIAIYGIEEPFPISTRFHYSLYAIVGLALGAWLLSDEDDKRIRYALYGFTFLALISLIPYIIQDKGWHYHAITILAYGMMALFIASYSLALKIIESKDVSIWIACSIIAILSFIYVTGGKSGVLTKGQYKALPIVDVIDERSWNRVYATYDFKNLLTPLPYIINDLENGSRFGQLWTLSNYLEKIKQTEDKEEREIIKKHMYEYVDMIVEDMKRYKPSVITIPMYKNPITDKPDNKYYEFLMKHDGFNKAMQNYIYEDRVPFDYSLAINNTNEDKIVPHEIFILKRDNDL